jgi:hypothetical protein
VPPLGDDAHEVFARPLTRIGGTPRPQFVRVGAAQLDANAFVRDRTLVQAVRERERADPQVGDAAQTRAGRVRDAERVVDIACTPPFAALYIAWSMSSVRTESAPMLTARP